MDIVQADYLYDLLDGLKRGVVEFYAIEGATNQDQAIEIVTKRFKEELNGVTQ